MSVWTSEIVFANKNSGFINGLVNSYIDNDTIKIHPGSIEINSKNYHQQTSIQVSLSTNLRALETEQNNTNYFIYAVPVNNSLSYKFSQVAPLMDRYENIVGSFKECESLRDWFHPDEGRTWRYIGKIYNKADGNILPYIKNYPGYLETEWISFSGNKYTNYYHYFGKPEYRQEILFKKSTSDFKTFPWIPCYVPNNSYGSHIYEIYSNYLVFFTASSGAFYDYAGDEGGGNGWNASGIVKFILTEV